MGYGIHCIGDGMVDFFEKDLCCLSTERNLYQKMTDVIDILHKK